MLANEWAPTSAAQAAQAHLAVDGRVLRLQVTVHQAPLVQVFEAKEDAAAVEARCLGVDLAALLCPKMREELSALRKKSRGGVVCHAGLAMHSVGQRGQSMHSSQRFLTWISSSIMYRQFLSLNVATIDKMKGWLVLSMMFFSWITFFCCPYATICAF